MPILEITNLSKSFGGINAVNNCSFAVEENSITGLIGPNGAGKTTLFDLITGLIKQDTGTIKFKNENIQHWKMYKRAQKGIGRTFQMIRLFPELRAIDNIVVTLKNHRENLIQSLFFTKKQARKLQEEALEILKLVDLEEKAELKAQELSYGQQKLLEIIRAISLESDLLLLDEPAAGVNPTMLTRIIKLIQQYHKEGRTFLIVEHNMNFVMSLCQKIIVLDYGKEIAHGTPQEIQNNPHVLEAYLGKSTAGS